MVSWKFFLKRARLPQVVSGVGEGVTAGRALPFAAVTQGEPAALATGLCSGTRAEQEGLGGACPEPGNLPGWAPTLGPGLQQIHLLKGPRVDFAVRCGGEGGMKARAGLGRWNIAGSEPGQRGALGLRGQMDTRAFRGLGEGAWGTSLRCS